jgi:lysophospholipase L1-like esterase
MAEGLGSPRSSSEERKGRRIAPVAILFVASVSLPCIAAELFLRWTAPPPNTPNLFIKAANPDIEAIGNPLTTGIYSGAEVSFNSLGLRDREFAVDRAPNVSRIIVLGDSITFGQGVPQDLTYPKVTEALLNRSLLGPERSVEVMNFGIPGYNTLHELAQLRETGLRYQPDLVVVGFLYNDVLPSSKAQSTSEPEGLRSSINRNIRALKKSSLLYARISPAVGEIVRRLGGKGFGQVGAFKYKYVDGDPDWLRVQSALLEMKELGEKRGFEVVVLIIPAMANCVEESYPLKEYHEAVAAFSKANGILHLDLLPKFWGIDARKFWVSPSDGHPNAEAHRLMAETLTEFLLARPGFEATGLAPVMTTSEVR